MSASPFKEQTESIKQLFEAGFRTAARTQYKKIIKKYPEGATWFHEEGVKYFHADEISTAIEYFKISQKLNGKNAEILYELGCCLSKQNNIPKALQYFRRAIDLQPDYVPALHALSKVLFRDGNIQDALCAIRGGLKLEPNNLLMLNTYGKLLYSTKAYTQAQEYFEMVISLDNTNFHALHNMAVIAYTKKNYTQALHYLLSAHKLNPNTKWGFNTLGLIHFKLNNYYKSIQAFKACQLEYPNAFDSQVSQAFCAMIKPILLAQEFWKTRHAAQEIRGMKKILYENDWYGIQMLAKNSLAEEKNKFFFQVSMHRDTKQFFKAIVEQDENFFQSWHDTDYTFRETNDILMVNFKR